ncbi:MAG TPA: hypothetical protein VFO89_06460, partial [Thermoanaerobaculia bacterium]|nr:hypothetical protein [Thermoanaerobaculia bacterium]
RAEKREAAAILDAIRRGDFYASTGVELESYTVSAESIALKVREKNGARYRIQFIGRGGRVLEESAGAEASYAIRGDEGYVRAKVIDSNGRIAWCQPVLPAAK